MALPNYEKNHNEMATKIEMNNKSTNGLDYNNYYKTGIYYFGENCANAPSTYCKLLVLGTDGAKGDTVQIAFAVSSGKIYRRTGRIVSGNYVWLDWKEIVLQ